MSEVSTEEELRPDQAAGSDRPAGRTARVVEASGDSSDASDESDGSGEGSDGAAAQTGEQLVGPAYARFDCTDDAQLGPGADAARHALEAGQCVVLPTDTVYGIGADAFSPEAVQRLLNAKGRGRDMPPPVLIADASLVRALATDVPSACLELTKAYWPGALTVIVTARSSSRMDLGETEGTIALRVPDHELARRLLRQTGPLAVSSANLSGRPAALDCDEAIGQLGERVSVYLDGGRLGDEGRPPSTIVDFSHSAEGRLLRRGAISLEQLREICPDLADLPEPDPEPGSGSASEPGSPAGTSSVDRPESPAARKRRLFTLQPPSRAAEQPTEP